MNKKPPTNPTMKLSSAAFREGQRIPVEYTCDGANVSPPLQWTDAPAGTKSFALICEDPDAPSGTWVHWVLYNLPPTTCELHQHLPTSELLSEGAKQGRTDFHRVGYGGPCPPPGKPHHYTFTVYALDAELPLAEGLNKADLLKAMEGHIVAQGSLVAIYERFKQ